VTFRLVGGPCDGNIVDATLLRLKPGDPIDCGGHRYIWNGGPTAPDTGPQPGSTEAAGVDTVQVGKAWHRLMHVISVESAQAIRRSQAARGRLKRLTR